TPFEIVNGVNPITPLDLAPLVVEKHISYAGEEYAQNVQQLHQHVREHIEKQNKKYKERVDKRRKKVVFKEGDLVWIRLGKERFPPGRFGEYDSIEECKRWESVAPSINAMMMCDWIIKAFMDTMIIPGYVAANGSGWKKMVA
nr:RNA-directed DNA polymerase [Tanacetum cinerariifolium]